MKKTLLIFAVSALAAVSLAAQSRIYVVTTINGTRLTTYTMDGQKVTPSLNQGMRDISGVAVAPNGNVYISNSGTRDHIMSFTPDGQPAGPTLNPGSINGISIDAAGTIYAQMGGSIRRFSLDGRQIGASIKTGLQLPHFAIGPDGKIYGVSQADDKVKIYEPDGTPTEITIRDGISTARAIAVAPDGRIYVGNFIEVTTYLPNGKRTRPTITHQTDTGPKAANALAVDAKGRIYMGFYGGGVAIYSPEGKLLQPVIKTPAGVVAIAIH